MHTVMSGGYAISFGIFALLHILKCFIHREIIPGNGMPEWLNITVLLLLMLLFSLRYFHYMSRREELVDRYYEAFCRSKKGNDKEAEQEQASAGS